MAEKRYTVVFDAKDMASSRLSEIERQARRTSRGLESLRGDTRRLGAESERAGNLLHRIGSGLSRMGTEGHSMIGRLSHGLGDVVETLGDIATAAIRAGVELAGMAARGVVDHMIKPAMTAEMTQMSIEGLSGNPVLGKEIYDLTKAKGMESMFADQPFMDTAQVFLNNTKDPQEIARGLNITERLATKNPSVAMGGGMEGAKVAISEVMAGDMTSIAERFNTSRSTLAAAGVSSSHDWLTNLEAVDRLLSEQGFTDEYVKKINESTTGQWEKLKSNAQTTLATIGKGMLEEIRPMMKTTNKLFEDQDGMEKFTTTMSGKFRDFLHDVFGLGDGVEITWKDITEWSSKTFDGLEDILKSSGKTFKSFVEILSGGDLKKPEDAFKSFGSILSGIAKKIDSIREGMEQIDKLGNKLGKMTGIGQKGGMQKQIDDGAWWLPEGAKGGRGLLGYLIEGMPSERMKKGDKHWFEGSHALGLSYVPKDNYIANLHQGERVLTRQENISYMKGLTMPEAPNTKANVATILPPMDPTVTVMPPANPTPQNQPVSQGTTVIVNMHGTIIREEADVNKLGQQFAREIVLMGAKL